MDHLDCSYTQLSAISTSQNPRFPLSKPLRFPQTPAPPRGRLLHHCAGRPTRRFIIYCCATVNTRRALLLLRVIYTQGITTEFYYSISTREVWQGEITKQSYGVMALVGFDTPGLTGCGKINSLGRDSAWSSISGADGGEGWRGKVNMTGFDVRVSMTGS